MGKRKKYTEPVTTLEFWNTPADDGITTAYCRTARELLFDPTYLKLTESAKGVYLLMRCSCGSNSNQWFKLPYSEAAKAGYSQPTFRRAIKLLSDLGFIEIKQEQNCGDPNLYRFIGAWRSH